MVKVKYENTTSYSQLRKDHLESMYSYLYSPIKTYNQISHDKPWILSLYLSNQYMISSLLSSWFNSYSFCDLWIKIWFKLCSCSLNACNSSFSAFFWVLLVYWSKLRVVSEDLKFVSCLIIVLWDYFCIILGCVIISRSRLLLEYFFKETLLLMVGGMYFFLGGAMYRFFRDVRQFDSMGWCGFLFYCRYKHNKINNKIKYVSLQRLVLREE